MRFFSIFEKLFSAIILGVRNFRVFEILEHLPYLFSKVKDTYHICVLFCTVE